MLNHKNKNMPVLLPTEGTIMEVNITPETSNNHVRTLTKKPPVSTEVALSKTNTIFNNCKGKVEMAYKMEIQRKVNLLTDESKKLYSLLSETEKIENEVKAFLDAKSFLFSCPLDCIKVHPKFENFTAYTIPPADRLSPPLPPPDKMPKVIEGVEVVTVKKSERIKSDLPPAGEFIRKPLEPGMKVYVMSNSSVDVFLAATVIAVRDDGSEKLYKILFHKGDELLKTNVIQNRETLFGPKFIAYSTPCNVIIPVQTRIIAKYANGFFAGVVAEEPKPLNKERYLIFFDDGYAQYTEHKDILVMCAQSENVADDVHKDIQSFIRDYFSKYPERAMVKCLKDQIIQTELQQKWWDAKVLEVDASLVKMNFLKTGNKEWIYRGSTRLSTLFKCMNRVEENRAAGRNRRHNLVARKPDQPYVEYTREDVVTLDSGDSEVEEEEEEPKLAKRPRRKTGGSQYLPQELEKKCRNTARKSTAVAKTKQHEAFVPARLKGPDRISHLGYRDINNLVNFKKVSYKLHKCSSACAEKKDPVSFKGVNPFLIPIHLGWQRQIRKYKGLDRNFVTYCTPCGRTLRNLDEILNYLFQVKSKITIDLFCIDPFLHLFWSFRAREIHYRADDVTQGKENVPVCVVNSWANEPPPFIEYAAKRYPGKEVPLNLDKEFLCGCTCTDNCQNPLKCECQQITQYAYSGNQRTAPVGYKYRRLQEPVITGIYECNERCKCSRSCLNRVIQHGLQVRLQMFKTKHKGWGIRCLDDLPGGMFVCIYAGQLLTEQGADEDGKQLGDEYLAELDHIETAEQHKQDYEECVPDIETMEVDSDSNKEDEEDNSSKNGHTSVISSDSELQYEMDSDYESSLRNTANTNYSTRSQKRNTGNNSDASLTKHRSSSGFSEDSSSNQGAEKKSLPDIRSSLDSQVIIPCALSPESLAFVENVELKSVPITSDDERVSKTVAKKSFSGKKTAPVREDHRVPEKIERKCARDYFGETELYIMDAKTKGNIGRYLNHSCSPNVFVQNVFVETHDLRFPEVAFFSAGFIQAGTELTWDYNYTVGMVEKKIMYCYCDSRSCRGRLL